MTKEQFSKSFQNMIDNIETLLREAVESKEVSSRERAIALKAAISKPLGVLNSKHGLVSYSPSHDRRKRQIATKLIDKKV